MTYLKIERMDKFCLILILFLSTSCATKYLVPGNRFITPETNGGAFKGQFEIQQTSANQLALNIPQSRVEGVVYGIIPRTGFMYSNSFFESFDLYWSHVASANSLVGGKLQIIGGSKATKSAGHKMSLAAAIGSNEHESDDGAVEFKLGGNEYLIIYGFRFNETVMVYSSLVRSVYNFNGTYQGSNPALRGLEPKVETVSTAINAGGEVSFGPFVGKLEGTYQELDSSGTKKLTQFLFGWTLGYSW